ncbi:MAG: hypothetical protein M3O36_17570 [Myxococcota bacterium]|nr:hypothetical protein [Myxococcota bacterium]
MHPPHSRRCAPRNRIWVALLIGTSLRVATGCGDSPRLSVTTDAADAATAADPATVAPPPAGQGIQMKTDAFAVPYGTEIQNCYFFKASDMAVAAGLDPTKPIDVHRIQIVQKPGSHHMNLFRVKTIVGLDPAAGAPMQLPSGPGTLVASQNGTGPCFASSNWADWPLFSNFQGSGSDDWSYPQGVVNAIDPGETLMLQTHYVNARTQGTPDSQGQVAINLWTLPPEQVQARVGTLFATNQSISICRSAGDPIFMTACQFKNSAPVTIIGANGHFHSRGTRFDIYSWDGTTTTSAPEASTRFYQSLTWDDPPMLHSPALNLVVPPGGGIRYTCAYHWQLPSADSGGCAALDAFDQKKYGTPATQLDCCYRFGPQVDVNEHCNAFIYYYPEQDSVGNLNCF